MTAASQKISIQFQSIRRCIVWIFEELRWIGRVILSSADRFYWGDGFSKAASLAYTTLLSLVPVTALIFSIIGSFAVSWDDGANVTRNAFYYFVPSLESAETVLQHLTEFSTAISDMNALVIVVLVMTSLLLLNSVEYALNAIWQVYEPRTLSHRIAIFCAILVIGPLLAISTYYTSFQFEPLFDQSGLSELLRAIYSYLWPFLIDYCAFLLLYYLVPKAPVQLRSASFGAVIAAFVFDVAKRLFAIYIVSFSSYEKVYGALASIPIFLFWLYLAWTIVLFGAELSYQAQYLPRKGRLWTRSVMTFGDGKMLLAMQALVLITRAFLKGEKLPNELDISQRLACSSVVLKPALDSLARAEIITRGDSDDMPIGLARHPDKITIEQIRNTIFAGREAMFYPAEMERLFSFFREGVDREKVTLFDVLDGKEQ